MSEIAVKDEIRTLLAKILDLAEPESIPINASMDSVPEWDSLAHVALIVSIERKYGIKIMHDELAFSLSLPDLTQLISNKLQGKKSSSRIFSKKSLMSPAELFSTLWAGDSLRDDEVIYVHSSMEGLINVCGSNIADISDLLKGGRNGKRTLVFPAFAFTGRTYENYVKEHPLFDVSVTPALTGLLPELLRKESGVFRSAHPFLSEYAIGPKAEWITKDAHQGIHPFHESSTYARLLDSDAVMVGLGVDMNTNAIIHMVDDKFRHLYPFDIYLKEPVRVRIRLADGSEVSKKYIAYSPETLKKIKPRRLRPHFNSFPWILKEMELGGVWFYRLRIRPFIEKCTEIAAESLNKGKLPPWYDERERL